MALMKTSYGKCEFPRLWWKTSFGNCSPNPGGSRQLSPAIHRLMVLQMSDLNSWVLNQDCGKQQQKLVYRALLKSDGNL